MFCLSPPSCSGYLCPVLYCIVSRFCVLSSHILDSNTHCKDRISYCSVWGGPYTGWRSSTKELTKKSRLTHDFDRGGASALPRSPRWGRLAGAPVHHLGSPKQRHRATLSTYDISDYLIRFALYIPFCTSPINTRLARTAVKRCGHIIKFKWMRNIQRTIYSFLYFIAKIINWFEYYT